MTTRSLAALLLTLAACQSPSDKDSASTASDAASFQIVHLSHAVANQLANTVEDAFGRSKTLRIVPDQRTNSVILSGTPDEIEKAKTLIRELDAAMPHGG